MEVVEKNFTEIPVKFLIFHVLDGQQPKSIFVC